MSNDATLQSALHKRLGIRPGHPGAVVGGPPDRDNPLLPLPDTIISVGSAEDLPEELKQLDYIHFFARSRAELTRVLPQLRDRLAPAGSLWISWITQSAVRGGGLRGDLNENVIRRMAIANGLVDVKVAALNQEWSALRLVFRKH
jgi:hypothetical protein